MKDWLLALRFFLIVPFAGLVADANSQTLEAFYKISQGIYVSAENGISRNIATIEFNGFLYLQGNRSIFYKKPSYLNNYADGYVRYSTGENSEQDFALVMDTIQGLMYKDFDSLIVRYRVDIPGSGINVKRPFKRGSQNWQFLSETKEIGGLKCQKAQFINGNGKLQWIVWFCPDIPAVAGPNGITDLPGLVVDEENVITNEKYRLMSYKSDGTLPANIFWPDEFNKPFK